MAFVDYALDYGITGKDVSGLGLTKTAAMTLEVATGSVTEQKTGTTHTLTAAQSHVFTADGSNITMVKILLITDDGSNVDVWIDTYVDDGTKIHDGCPSGFRVIHDIAWFKIAANETDLANSTINRRIAA
jgi:hypothetical protein